jgi:hypothetical protein
MGIGLALFIGATAFAVFGPIGKQIRFGNHVAKLTNIFERLEMTRVSMPIGAGGGLDSLPDAEGWEASKTMDASLSFLKKQPRHEVTNVLIKNLRLAHKMRRTLRVEAIGKLLEYLVNRDIALDVDKFMESYG